jgi:SPP1 family predicted phage head-tail adaptor
MSVFTSLLNHTFVVSRKVRLADGQGGYPFEHTSIDAQNGRLRPASSSEKEAAMREGREITHVLYTLAGANIQRGDQVTANGLTVDVLAIRNPSQANEHWEIDCKETQLETPEAVS